MQASDIQTIQRLGKHMVPGFMQIAQQTMGGFVCICDACRDYLSLKT